MIAESAAVVVILGEVAEVTGSDVTVMAGIGGMENWVKKRQGLWMCVAFFFSCLYEQSRYQYFLLSTEKQWNPWLYLRKYQSGVA